MKRLSPKQYAELLYELTAEAKKSEVSERTERFLDLLVRQRTVVLVPSIIQAFGELWNERHGIIHVETASVRKLSHETHTEFLKTLGARELELEEHTDPAVIGGLRIKIRDTIIDGSLETQLVNLRKTLTQ